MTDTLSFSRRIRMIVILATASLAIWLLIYLPAKNAFSSVGYAIVEQQTKATRLRQSILLLETGPDQKNPRINMFWTGSSSNQIGAEFQRMLSDLAAQNQIRFNSVTPLAKNDVSGFETVSVRVEGETTYSDLLIFLNGLNTLNPKISVGALAIRQLPLRADQAFVPISFQLTLWGIIDVEEAE